VDGSRQQVSRRVKSTTAEEAGTKMRAENSPRAKAKAIKYKLATHPPTRRAAVVVGRIERNAGKGPFTRTLRAAALRYVVQT